MRSRTPTPPTLSIATQVRAAFLQTIGDIKVLRPYWDRANLACIPTSTRNQDALMAEYQRLLCGSQLPHSEKMLTLLSLFGLFGPQDPASMASARDPLNRLLRTAYEPFGGTAPIFTNIHEVRVEVCLKEIAAYKAFLRNNLGLGPSHPYADRSEVLDGKLAGNGSVEGNTNLDVYIGGDGTDGPVHVFIEAKYLSDISQGIRYSPFRNQIARNIDAGLSCVTGGQRNGSGIGTFWFLLLTPRCFRTDAYGGNGGSRYDAFAPQLSRLYCYKMNDYRDADHLKADLGDWSLSKPQWQEVSRRIGWLSYGDIRDTVVVKPLLEPVPLAAYEAACGIMGLDRP